MDTTVRDRISRLDRALGLPRPAIALARVDAPPEGVGRPDTEVPSACSFWRMAERDVFYASQDDHLNCPVGVMTMGFQVPPERQEEADAIVGTMCDLDYISPEEAASLPSLGQGHQGIVYGPLSQFPVDPDVVLFFCRPGQAMILAEASGSVSWTGSGISAFGRPTCAAIPMAVRAASASVSMGCVGFRVYTGIPDEELLMAVPAPVLPELARRLDTILSANSTLEGFHAGRRGD